MHVPRTWDRKATFHNECVSLVNIAAHHKEENILLVISHDLSLHVRETGLHRSKGRFQILAVSFRFAFGPSCNLL